MVMEDVDSFVWEHWKIRTRKCHIKYLFIAYNGVFNPQFMVTNYNNKNICYKEIRGGGNGCHGDHPHAIYL